MKFVLKFLLKIMFIPVFVLLTFLIWLCTLVLTISATLMNLVSVLLVLGSISCFIDHRTGNGVAGLFAAFLFSPYGLPMVGAWLIAHLHIFRDWIKEGIYG